MAEPLWSEDSFHEKEKRKWNTPKSQGGMRCDGYEAFPRMLYKAQLNPLSGKYEALLQRDVISADRTTVLLHAEQFNASCQLTVNDESEYQRAKADGWRDTPNEAMEKHEGKETEKMVAAAVRNYEDRNMSEKAKAEAQAFEDSTPDQVSEVPTADKRRASLEKARAAKAAKRNTAA